MKRYVPIVVAIVLFLVGLMLASGVTTPTKAVVVAAQDLSAGHTITENDVTVVAVTNPPVGAITDPDQVIGQTLAVPRMAGDVITAAALGGMPDLTERLKPDERLVAVKVSLSSGIAGLLRPGDRVGVTMVVNQGDQIYAKATVEDLRVVWVSPDFQPQLANQEDALGVGGGITLNTQAREGVVALAVPVEAMAVVYDFSELGLPPEIRRVNAVELLSALDQGGTQVKLSLYLVPDDKAQPLASAGLVLPSLVVTPGPTPTPGAEEVTTATPTP